MKKRIKKNYAERQEVRIKRIAKTLGALESAASNAPDEWGESFRNAVGLMEKACTVLCSIEIPSDYKRKVRSVAKPGGVRFESGDTVVVRSKMRRDVYRTMIPTIDEVGVVVRTARVNETPSAWVTFGALTYGPVPTRYLSPAEDEASAAA